MIERLADQRALASQSFQTTVRILHQPTDQTAGCISSSLTLPLDSAASAVRNLNDHEIMGRKLRVDFSNETVSDEDNRDRDGAVRSLTIP